MNTKNTNRQYKHGGLCIAMGPDSANDPVHQFLLLLRDPGVRMARRHILSLKEAVQGHRRILGKLMPVSGAPQVPINFSGRIVLEVGPAIPRCKMMGTVSILINDVFC